MKKVLVAALIVAVTMMALAVPAFAHEDGVPYHGASLGKWRHTQAPGQDTVAPGQIGGDMSEKATTAPQAVSTHVHIYTPNAHTDPYKYPGQ